MCKILWLCFDDLSFSVSVLDVCCGHHHACSMWGLHASFSYWWTESTVFPKCFLSSSCSGKKKTKHPVNNLLLYLCVTFRRSIWQTCWRDHGGHVSWWHTCWWQRVSHSSGRLCCSGWVALNLFLFKNNYYLIAMPLFTFRLSRVIEIDARVKLQPFLSLHTSL